MMKIEIKKINQLLFTGIFLTGSFCDTARATATLTQAQANACALQSNGDTLVAGAAIVNSANEFIVARYTTNGTLDDTFNGTGYATTPIGTSATALGIVTQSTGQSVAVGYASVNGVTQVALACYSSSGSLNTNFGTGGIVTTALGNGATGNAITQDASGNLIVAGVANYSYVPQFFVARYNASTGNLDTTFNASGSTPGVATVQINFRCAANGVVVLSTGKILVCGSSSSASGDQFALARFNSNGSLDTTFNAQGSQPGVVTTQIGTIACAQSIAVQSNGNIILAGSSDGSLCAASYTSAGVLNTGFASSGIILNSIGNQANDVVIDSSGNIVMTGISNDSLLVIRYTSTGSLDTTFNSSGYAILAYQGDDAGNALQILNNGDILSVGFFTDTVTDFLLVAYTTTGVLDSSWQINGVVPNAFSSMLLSDQQPTGTNDGTFTAGSWLTRTLNTVSNGNGTLSNNQFTLEPGLYTISVAAPAYCVNGHQARLQNVTDGVTTMLGTTGFSPNSGGSMTSSYINGQFSITKTTVFEIQHICATTQANNGFGIASGFGTEIYTNVMLYAEAIFS